MSLVLLLLLLLLYYYKKRQDLVHNQRLFYRIWMNKCSEYDILSNKIARRKVCFKRFLSSKFARNAKYGSLVAVILTLNNKSVSDFRSIEHCYKKSSTFSHRNACVNVGFVGFVDCCSSTTRRLIVLFSCGDQLTSAV